ncbi:capsule biosynthesis protein [Novosphingobium sp.]|uniref:capsule biosynthesis protein n=1 Tax=Novosphingobium sp. TaxID=1874826 RepID=UPI003BABBD01
MTTLQRIGRLRERRVRLIIYLVLGAVLAVLCLFPRPYMARAKVVPGDNNAASLFSMSGAGSQLQNLASLFGDRSATEVTLQLAKSDAVGREVIARLNLVGPGRPYADERTALVALGKRVDVHSLLGGIIEFETRAYDQDWALAVTKTYVDAMSERMGSYVRVQVSRKRRIVEDRLGSSQERLIQAQAQLEAFRKANRIADPGAQLGEQLTVRAGLEGQLQAKQVELATLRAISGPENPRLKVVAGQVASLQSQIARAATASEGQPSPNVGAITAVTLAYARLYRNYVFAQGVSDVYSRAAEEIAVQEIVSQDRAQLSVIDAPHVDADRYFNTTAVALLALLAALVVFVEVYAPATGLFDPGAGPRRAGHEAGPQAE